MLAQIKKAGIKIYGNPLLKFVKNIEEDVTIGEQGDYTALIVKSENYENSYSIKIIEGNESVMFHIRSSSDPRAEQFNIAEFICLVDDIDKKLVKGEPRYYAVSV